MREPDGIGESNYNIVSLKIDNNGGGKMMIGQKLSRNTHILTSEVKTV